MTELCSMAGILNEDYHIKRKINKGVIHRLDGRTEEVIKTIEKHMNHSKLRCLDIGTADGLMLSRINKIFSFDKAVGIDMSEGLIKTNKDKEIELEVGNAENLRFKDDYFDIIISAASIEHLDNPNKMLSECYRVLRRDGILIITTPNPFHDKIASIIIKEDHVETFTIKKLIILLEKNGFKIVGSRHFMFFPIFKTHLEKYIEPFLRLIKLGGVMSNQLVIGKKFSEPVWKACYEKEV